MKNNRYRSTHTDKIIRYTSAFIDTGNHLLIYEGTHTDREQSVQKHTDYSTDVLIHKGFRENCEYFKVSHKRTAVSFVLLEK